MVEKIEYIITLQGKDQIKSDFAEVQRAGEQSFAGIRAAASQAFGGGGAGGFKLSSSAAEMREFTGASAALAPAVRTAAVAVDTAGLSIGRFREGLHLLHPVLRAAGVELGGLRQWSMAASAGFGALATVAGGVAAISLVRASDAAQAARLRLGDFLRDQAQGARVLADLQRQGAVGLAPSIESMVSAGRVPLPQMRGVYEFGAGAGGGRLAGVHEFVSGGEISGAGPSRGMRQAETYTVEQEKQAATALYDVLRLGAEGHEKATTAANNFFESLRKGRTVTTEMVDQIRKVGGEKAADTLAQVLIGAPESEQLESRIKAGAKFTVPRVVQGLADYQDQAAQQFKEYQQRMPFGEALTEGFRGAKEKVAPSPETSVALTQWFQRLGVHEQGGAAEEFSSNMAALGNAIAEGVSGVVGQIQAGIAKLRTASGGAGTSGAGAGGGGTSGWAGGGPISGPGTGTSDSIIARLSAGEYVVNARSTSRFRPLLEKLNAYAEGGQIGYAGSTLGRGDPSLSTPERMADELLKAQDRARNAQVEAEYARQNEEQLRQWQAQLDSGQGQRRRRAGSFAMPSFSMPSFASGGLVGHLSDSIASSIDVSLPRFAGGGEAGRALHPVTINLPGGQSITGWHAEPSAVDQLGDYATAHASASAGRRASWNR